MHSNRQFSIGQYNHYDQHPTTITTTTNRLTFVLMWVCVKGLMWTLFCSKFDTLLSGWICISNATRVCVWERGRVDHWYNCKVHVEVVLVFYDVVAISSYYQAIDQYLHLWVPSLYSIRLVDIQSIARTLNFRQLRHTLTTHHTTHTLPCMHRQSKTCTDSTIYELAT